MIKEKKGAHTFTISKNLNICPKSVNCHIIVKSVKKVEVNLEIKIPWKNNRHKSENECIFSQSIITLQLCVWNCFNMHTQYTDY